MGREYVDRLAARHVKRRALDGIGHSAEGAEVGTVYLPDASGCGVETRKVKCHWDIQPLALIEHNKMEGFPVLG
jgi:hypothetical protein